MKYQCTVKMWIWFNRSKGRKGKIWLISHFLFHPILSKTIVTFSLSMHEAS